ncbi:MAG: AAA family ATPase [Alphaproteobacteria bacterium]|nr:AAA family ATPase [Alphaproteobacteria bacterium]
MDVAAWLRTLGLEQYEAAFRQGRIGADRLPSLTAKDLRDLGVVAVDDRRRLSAAIAALPPAPAFDTASRASLGTAAPDAERRHITVMFCDLAASTALSSRLDPEDLREVIARYHAAIMATVRGFDGTVAKYMGDGAMVYFGFPHSHEDDAEQAVRAGLGLVEAVAEIPIAERLRVRVGIATGEVVIGDLIGSGSAREHAVVGNTPNLAARLQALAEPNAVLIADGTRRQIGSRFQVADLGPQNLKGFAEPQRAWRVVSENRSLGRFETLRSSATPLVGRDEEVALLCRCWWEATARGGRVALISGEPGIGKSRLVETLAERIAGEPHVQLRYFCFPHHQESALYPIIAQMERAAGFVREDSPAQRLAKLQAMLAARGTRTAAGPMEGAAPSIEDVTLLADMHSLPGPDGAPPPAVSPQQKKEKTFDALLRHIGRLSQQRPVLLVFEDIHWIDPSSRELLERIVARIAAWPALLVATFRPEVEPHWTGQPEATTLALTRLDPADTAAMVANITGDAALPADIVQEIARRTDGVPLFVEELTRVVLESGAAGAAAQSATPHAILAVPDTLRASLIARLDRLGAAAKDVAQRAAVIGREFSYELLAAIANMSELRLRQTLRTLTTSGLLLLPGNSPQSTYVFKHALVQDAAYDTLLRGRRRQLHARIAAVLEAQFGETARTRPELLALHHERAGNLQQAFEYWTSAGDRCEHRGNSAEAVLHYRSALALLDAADAPHSILLREPEVCIKLGNTLMQAQGFNSEAGRQAFERAQSAAARLESPEEYAQAGIGIAPLLFGQSRCREVIEIGEEIAARLLDRLRPQTRVHLWTLLGVAHYCTGEFPVALEHVARAAALDNSVRCTHENPVGGADPAVVCRSYAGMITTALGLLETSFAWSQEAVAIADNRGHAFSMAWARLTRMRSLRPLGRNAELIAAGAEAIEICERHGFNARLGNVLIYHGAARFEIGEHEAGLADMQRGIDLWRRTSGSLHVTQWIGELVPCLLRLGRTEAAERALQEAEAIIAATAEQSHYPEIQRLRGALLQRSGRTAEAIDCCQRALAWSRAHQARLFELRAGVALAQLWRDAGQRAQARALLAPIHAGFTEGLDAPDLKAAKRLLASLDTQGGGRQA